MKWVEMIFERYPVKTRRALEILPGATAYLLITFPLWGAIWWPVAVAYFVLAFDVYWLYKSISIAIFGTIAHLRLKAAQKVDWLKEAQGFADWEKVKHILIVPIANESVEILRPTIKSLAEQSFPHKNLLVVMSFENHFADWEKRAKTLMEEFGENLPQLTYTAHELKKGEVRGKSSNESWGGKFAYRKFIEKEGGNINYFTISSADSDTTFHSQYFAYLTYKFLDDPNRYRRFWHPAVLFYRNIWRVPAIIRSLNCIGSVWRTAILARRDRLVQMSMYSASLKMIKEVGFWDTDVIPEDYRIFFKCFYAFNGKVEVEPIYLPALVDAAESTSFWKTMKNQYEQMKRWAWGVSDDPLFMKWYLTRKGVSFWDKTVHLIKVLEDHFLWPVNWFIITIGANLPPLVNPAFNKTAIGYNLPRMASFILTLCLIGLIAIIIIDLRQRPKRPEWFPKWRLFLSPLEYALLPIAGFFLSTLPGLDAHTRLMLGKYLEYRVTEKV